MASDTLKGGHQTSQTSQNENCWRPSPRGCRRAGETIDCARNVREPARTTPGPGAPRPGAKNHDFPPLKASLNRLRLWAGVDRAIFYTLLNRGWYVFTGPLSIYLIARCLTQEEQGYYFTFSSILGLQMVFELGLGFVIIQYASHEKAHLEWTAAGTLEGDPEAKARLASLFRFGIKCYCAVAVVGGCVLVPAGLAFFGKSQPGGLAVVWRTPWLLVVGITCFNLTLTPIYSLLEGCGKVAEFAKRGAWMSIIGNAFFWLVLLAHGKLFAAPAQAAVFALIGTSWVFVKYGKCFKDLLATPIPPGKGLNWRKEILPFQWKIALSAFSGYFIFQLANPILFRYRGPAEAGRFGMSTRITDILLNLAYSWVSTKSAPFGTYIARKDYATLDSVFRKASRQAIGVLLRGSVAFLVVYFALRMTGASLAARFLDPLAIYFLLGNAVLNCIIFCQAIYLRAHKQEPFLYNTVAAAVLVPLVIYYLGRPYGGLGVAAGLFSLNLLIGLPWATWKFLQKRKQWHSNG